MSNWQTVQYRRPYLEEQHSSSTAAAATTAVRRLTLPESTWVILSPLWRGCSYGRSTLWDSGYGRGENKQFGSAEFTIHMGIDILGERVQQSWV